MNGASGMSDIEGKAAREAASECGQRASFNGAVGISDMAGADARMCGRAERERARHKSKRKSCRGVCVKRQSKIGCSGGCVSRVVAAVTDYGSSFDL